MESRGDKKKADESDVFLKFDELSIIQLAIFGPFHYYHYLYYLDIL